MTAGRTFVTHGRSAFPAFHRTHVGRVLTPWLEKKPEKSE